MIKPLIYRDIDPTRYLISDDGIVYSVTGKRFNGCNIKNERGYVRITLVTKSGKLKKYSIHRLVLAVFTYDCDLPIDHIDCDKTHNWLSNLEYVTTAENNRRAGINKLKPYGEANYNSTFKNETVHKICQLLEKNYNTRKIIRELGLNETSAMDQAVNDIARKNTWLHISKDYNWDIDDVRLKVYSHEDLKEIARSVIMNEQTRIIANRYPQYDTKKLIQTIKKMKQGKLYKTILDEVRRPTTINGFVRIHSRYKCTERADS